MTNTVCGEPRSDGDACQWDVDAKGPCPFHGDNADPNTRDTLLEQQPEIKEIVVGELQAGATVPEACAEAGISKNQYYDWCNRGDEPDCKPVFSDFSDETTHARRIASKQDRQNLKERCMETDDTRTWYKLHHDQYGDTYGKEESEERATGGETFAVPDELIEKWQQEA